MNFQTIIRTVTISIDPKFRRLKGKWSPSDARKLSSPARQVVDPCSLVGIIYPNKHFILIFIFIFSLQLRHTIRRLWCLPTLQSRVVLRACFFTSGQVQLQEKLIHCSIKPMSTRIIQIRHYFNPGHDDSDIFKWSWSNSDKSDFGQKRFSDDSDDWLLLESVSDPDRISDFSSKPLICITAKSEIFENVITKST